MDLERYCRLRPFVYHLTAADNLNSVLNDGRLISASQLLAASHMSADIRVARKQSIVVHHQGRRTWIRDQQPLHPRNCALPRDWSFEDLVEHLNHHVYFWPGTADTPVRSGVKHFERYSSENAVVLRIPVEQLLKANGAAPALFSRVNSGAPRWSGGKPSPRTPNVFVEASVFDGTPSDVVELVYRGEARLPSNLEVLNPRQWRAVISQDAFHST